ncbi:hypothetical protein LY78DRAFT_686972 [Colletotrichum sublineola]|nr:hypothetical protein LY78DRAFT_686972 [Colletotrichum sublineola]
MAANTASGPSGTSGSCNDGTSWELMPGHATICQTALLCSESPSNSRPDHEATATATWFQTSLVYPTPTPPYYIHELRAIMDLTTLAEEDNDDDDDGGGDDDDNDGDGNDDNGAVLDWTLSSRSYIYLPGDTAPPGTSSLVCHALFIYVVIIVIIILATTRLLA